MEIWQAIVLGILQGVSEFLPISSSGHLLLFEKLGIGNEDMFFNIMLHVATLVAVLIAMRKEWIPLVLHPINKTNGYIIITCIPTIVMALLFKCLAPSLLTGAFLGGGFILSAIFMYIGEYFKTTKSTLYNTKNALLTGVMQGIAVLPGVSRSGTTISTMTFLGIEKDRATSLSFLISIPIIVGSAILEIIDLAMSKSSIATPPLYVIVGMICAFISGYISINTFIKYMKKHSMTPFIIYTLLLGIMVNILPIIKANI